MPVTAFPSVAEVARATPPDRDRAIDVIRIAALLAVITGHISLSQIKKTGEQGNILAIIGLILGYLEIVGVIIFGIVWIGIIAAAGTAGMYSN